MCQTIEDMEKQIENKHKKSARLADNVKLSNEKFIKQMEKVNLTKGLI